MQTIPYDKTFYDLPVTICLINKEKYKPVEKYSKKMYAWREEEEEGSIHEFVVDDGLGCISEEELTNIFFRIFNLLSALNIIPPLYLIYSGSKISVVSDNITNTVTFTLNISFLFLYNVIFGNIRDYLEFIKFIVVDRPNNRWFSYCGRCTHLYSVDTPLGCPCLLEESSGDEGYDTD